MFTPLTIYTWYMELIISQTFRRRIEKERERERAAANELICNNMAAAYNRKLNHDSTVLLIHATGEN
jgi:hypothetical protein